MWAPMPWPGVYSLRVSWFNDTECGDEDDDDDGSDDNFTAAVAVVDVVGGEGGVVSCGSCICAGMVCMFPSST